MPDPINPPPTTPILCMPAWYYVSLPETQSHPGEVPVTALATRDRLVVAAFDLFAARGFDGVTVDEIAGRAGVSRSTFFRLFPTKEAVILPDHDPISKRVDARLSQGDAKSAERTLFEAARVVLRHYVEEGELARQRYRLTSSVPLLRDTEIAGQRRYQELFRQHLGTWLTGSTSALRAEVIANVVVTVHNHVLRQWLRGSEPDPETALATGLGESVRALWSVTAPRAVKPRIVVLESDRPTDELIAGIRRLLGAGARS
jgi:AcrR family transcriptional regulator